MKNLNLFCNYEIQAKCTKVNNFINDEFLFTDAFNLRIQRGTAENRNTNTQKSCAQYGAGLEAAPHAAPANFLPEQMRNFWTQICSGTAGAGAGAGAGAAFSL